MTLWSDPGFRGLIGFLSEEHCPTWASDQVIPDADAKLRAREFRKMKRRLQRANPAGWKEVWRTEYLPVLKELSEGELHLRISPTRSEIAYVGPLNPHIPDDVRRTTVEGLERSGVPRATAREMVGRPGRPRDPVWALIWLLKALLEIYFGRPCWSLIAEIIGRGYDYETVQSGWQKNKDRFAMLNAEAFLCSALNRYERICSGAAVSPFLTALRSKLAAKELGRQQRLREIIEMAKKKALVEWSSSNEPITSDTQAAALQEIERTLSVCISDDLLERELTEVRPKVEELIREVLDGETKRRRARERGPAKSPLTAGY